MTLPVSGAISFNNINVELGVSGTTQASLGQASYRALAGVASGAISMSNFYGKANQFAFTISSNQTNANLRTLAVNAGWNGTSKVVATINGGVFVYSTSTGTPALTINGSFPNGVQLNNNGTIQGMGGGGGIGGTTAGNIPGAAGGGGGLALSVSVGVSINNAGRIAGGGGGGGGAGMVLRFYGKGQAIPLPGSGGGGGLGGGAGGAARTYTYYTSNAGQAGTLTSAGNGGAAKIDSVSSGQFNLAGANGGSYGSAGGTGPSGSGGQTAMNGGAGGAAGGCITGNGNISWIAFGTRNGGIS